MNTKIRYKIIECVYRNTRGYAGLRYRTVLLTNGKLSEDEVIEQLSKQTGVKETKLGFILDELRDIITRKCLEGYIVSVPRIGSFRISSKSVAVTDEKKAGKAAIRSLSINYLPDTRIAKDVHVQNVIFKEEKDGQ